VGAGERARFIGSPKTVAEQIRKAAEIGMFNTMMCEFNFADLPDAATEAVRRERGVCLVPIFAASARITGRQRLSAH
jgi:alkanesulfonate monooxygenase SsuD/methylene tetrahydromethanopterin reductase-like flavin-dependent oxidoreductase (luciferase family)